MLPNPKSQLNNGKAEVQGGRSTPEGDGSLENTKIEVDPLDNGEAISVGPTNKGTVKEDMNGAHINN